MTAAPPMLPAVILAGGLATRLRPMTERIPKSLLEVEGEPFIAHQLRLLKGQDIGRVVICAGYLGEMIEELVGSGGKFGLDVAYSYDGDRLLGTGGAIRRALPKLGEAFFVVYGDSYLPCDWRAVQQAFTDSGRTALMTVYHNQGQFDRSNIEFADGQIRIYSKTQTTPAMHHIDYGLGLFRREAFAGLIEDQPYDLAQIYQDLLARQDLAAFEVETRFYEIGSIAGLEETKAYIRAQER